MSAYGEKYNIVRDYKLQNILLDQLNDQQNTRGTDTQIRTLVLRNYVVTSLLLPFLLPLFIHQCFILQKSPLTPVHVGICVGNDFDVIQFS